MISWKRYVYWWPHGVYLIGATKDRAKELLAVVDGYRESTIQSWGELLQQLKRQGALRRAGHPVMIPLASGRFAGRIWPNRPAAPRALAC